MPPTKLDPQFHRLVIKKNFKKSISSSCETDMDQNASRTVVPQQEVPSILKGSYVMFY
jgi:hypothetical protein